MEGKELGQRSSALKDAYGEEREENIADFLDDLIITKEEAVQVNLGLLEEEAKVDSPYVLIVFFRSGLKNLIEGGPWNFSNCAIILKPYNGTVRPSEIMFDTLAV